MHLNDDVVRILEDEGFVVVATLDSGGRIHTAAKGVVGVNAAAGEVSLADLYFGTTHANLKKNATLTITVINEAQFLGYALQGIAQIIVENKINSFEFEKWQKKMLTRIAKRVIGNVQKEKKGTHQPEASLPHLKYIIKVSVEKVIDLSPRFP